MTIECYYSVCKHHSIHDNDDGPFCYEPYCKASDEDLKEFEALRRRELLRMTNELIAESQSLKLEY